MTMNGNLLAFRKTEFDRLEYLEKNIEIRGLMIPPPEVVEVNAICCSTSQLRELKSSGK